MATEARQHHAAEANGAGELRDWQRTTRVFLQPIAAPSILGLFGFAGATFIVAAHLAGWYGGPTSSEFLFPFAAAFGGFAQFAAAMWAFRARDGLATAVHGMWGSFWIAYGILNLLAAVGVFVITTGTFPELGYWFLALAVITGVCMLAALGENLGITSVLATLAVGSAFAAVLHYLTGIAAWEQAAGWVLVASAILAVYTAGALMIAATWGRTILPIGEYRKAANVPGAGRCTRSSTSWASPASGRASEVI